MVSAVAKRQMTAANTDLKLVTRETKGFFTHEINTKLTEIFRASFKVISVSVLTSVGLNIT